MTVYDSQPGIQHHLAVLYRPLLTDILEGRKTVECRLGQVSTGPHESVRPGDLIWLKEVGGRVRGVATAKSVRSFKALTPRMIKQIRRQWGPMIRAPEAFWRAHRTATVATLIWLGDVVTIEPFTIEKADRRAWVVLPGPLQPGQKI